MSGKRFEQRPWRDADTPGARDQKDAMERQRAERERYQPIIVLEGEALERARRMGARRRQRLETAAKRCAGSGHLWRYGALTMKTYCVCCGKNHDDYRGTEGESR